MRYLYIVIGLLLLTSVAAAQTPAPVPAPSGAGVIDIGAAFGWLQPYINAAVGAFLTALASWIMWVLRVKMNIQIEDSHRDALLAAAKNRASGLIADGFVRLSEQGKIEIKSQPLAGAVNVFVRAVPDAINHFGLTTEDIERRIKEAIPQVPDIAVKPDGQVIAAVPAK